MEGSTKESLKDRSEERNKEISSRAADSASTSLAAILDTAYTSTVDPAPTVNSGERDILCFIYKLRKTGPLIVIVCAHQPEHKVFQICTQLTNKFGAIRYYSLILHDKLLKLIKRSKILSCNKCRRAIFICSLAIYRLS